MAKAIPIGASIANSGACLTVVGVEPREGGSAIAFDVGAERGHVNLERALRVGDELGGHMVSGHVDGVRDAGTPPT